MSMDPGLKAHWNEIVGTANRVKLHEAKRAFANGETIMLSEYGREETHKVSRGTTTITNARTSWDEVEESRKMWMGRYPNQRYYIVTLDGK